MEMISFNLEHGYLEGIIRGYKAGLLSQNQFSNLTQCETLEDMKLQLSSTDYGNFLANEAADTLTTSVIAERATNRLVDEFNYIKANSEGELTKFLDFMTYSYMIDNTILLITGTLHERDTHDLLERCHPLGVFDNMPALCVATNTEELFNSVLVESPLAPFFREALSAADLDELNIEIIRNTLYKHYLEAFYQYCRSLGGPTADLMGEILEFEADRRTINIAVNSLGTGLTKEQRAKLFPAFGRLYPAGNSQLARADDMESIKSAVEAIAVYRDFFSPTSSSSADDAPHVAAESLEDHFYREEVELNKRSFYQQFGFGVFFSFFKLKEQEIRSIVWIAECIAQNARDRIQDYVAIF